MNRSFKFHVFLSVTLCVVAFVGLSRMVVRLTSGEPFRMYFSEVLAQQMQKELDSNSGEFDLTAFQSNIEKTVLQIRSHDMLVFTDNVKQSDDVIDFSQTLAAPHVQWESLQTKPFEATSIVWHKKTWRVVRVLHDKQHLYIGVNAAAFQKALDQILEVRNQISVLMFPILIIFVVLTTAFIVYVVLKPITDLQHAFNSIKLSDPHEHIENANKFREFEVFIQYFNQLIDRLRASYAQAARFSSDAAHELRTPLTIIRGRLHRLMNQLPDGSSEQIELSLVSDEVERLISISKKLLFLSQADAGQVGLEKEEFNLAELVEQMMDDIRNYRPDLILTKHVSDVIKLRADRDLMYQLMNNLFDNAIKYNYQNGSIEFRAHVIDHDVHFSISNTTSLSLVGLDDRIFERFYRHLRVEGSGNNGLQGSGLGLSLCKEIARIHGGDLHLQLKSDRTVCIEGKISIST